MSVVVRGTEGPIWDGVKRTAHNAKQGMISAKNDAKEGWNKTKQNARNAYNAYRGKDAMPANGGYPSHFGDESSTRPTDFMMPNVGAMQRAYANRDNQGPTPHFTFQGHPIR